MKTQEIYDKLTEGLEKLDAEKFAFYLTAKNEKLASELLEVINNYNKNLKK